MTGTPGTPAQVGRNEFGCTDLDDQMATVRRPLTAGPE